MDKWKRLIYYLLLNVLVSACTITAVLFIWERTHPAGQPAPLAAVASPTSSVQLPLATVELTPQSSPTPTEIPRPLGPVEEYQVEFGDTLGLIAEQYDVSVEEIMQVNQLTDANSLAVGMVLYIPLKGENAPTVTPRPSLPPQVSSTPSGPPQEARVIINSVIGAGDLASEQVFLGRVGDGDLSLAGWKLQDEDGNEFVFPQLELYQGGAVLVWTKAGSNTAVDLYWGLASAVWQSGEKVTLRDAAGAVRATLSVP
jgi:LysM repeat protein